MIIIILKKKLYKTTKPKIQIFSYLSSCLQIINRDEKTEKASHSIPNSAITLLFSPWKKHHLKLSQQFFIGKIY